VVLFFGYFFEQAKNVTKEKGLLPYSPCFFSKKDLTSFRNPHLTGKYI